MYVNCAFEGGGIKGLSYVGVMKYMEEHGLQVFKASGTSVGALFAALSVSKYRSSELMKIIDMLSVKTLASRNGPLGMFRGLGINNIQGLEYKIEEILSKKCIWTFQDLKYGNDYLLKIVTTDYQKRKQVIIPDDLPSYGIDKDSFKVAKAIAMSSSLPIFYSVYTYKEHKFIDGGLSNKFPIELVENSSNPVIGFRLSNSKSLISEKRDIIYIDTLGIKTSQFQKGLEKRECLYNSGYNSIDTFYKRKKSRI